jgi:hypothetical protein
MASFVYSYVFAAQATDSISFFHSSIHFLNSIFVTSQDFAMTDLVVFPQLPFTSSTSNNEHGTSV